MCQICYYVFCHLSIICHLSLLTWLPLGWELWVRTARKACWLVYCKMWLDEVGQPGIFDTLHFTYYALGHTKQFDSLGVGMQDLFFKSFLFVWVWLPLLLAPGRSPHLLTTSTVRNLFLLHIPRLFCTPATVVKTLCAAHYFIFELILLLVFFLHCILTLSPVLPILQ